MALEVGTVSSLGLNSAKVREFYKKNWNRPTMLSDEAFYAWQFESCPSSERDDLIIAYDRANSVIAGTLGLNAHNFDLSGERVLGADLTTWIVADAYRLTGVGLAMLDHAMRDFGVLIAFGISPKSLPVFLRCGFRYVKAIPRFVRAYNIEKVAELGSVDRLARKLNDKWIPLPDRPSYSVAGPGISDGTWLSFSETHHGYIRDAVHLEWRYSSHPFFKYSTFEITTTNGRAFVAMRIEDAVPGIRIMHVTDVFGDDEGMAAAFDFIDQFATSHNVDVADFYCMSASVNKHPISRGWFSILDDTYLQFPHLFHPVEVRQPATTSMVYWSRSDFLSMSDFSKLYITKADADFDRPVPHG